jgi:hypothetical protein
MLAVSVALVGTEARAARYEVTAFGGYRWGGKVEGGSYDPSSPGNYGYDLKINDGPNFGIVVDWNTITPQLQLEVFWEHQATDLRINDNVTGEQYALFDVNVDYWHAGILYEISQPYENAASPPVRPFLGLTLGATRFGPQTDRYEKAWRFSVGFMGGVKTFVNERVGFRFQSRLMTTYFQGDSGSFCDNTGVCFTVLGATLMNQIDLTAGVIFTF